MRSVNVSELESDLSTYLTFAKAGEEVVIRDQNRPIAKLIPFVSEDSKPHEEPIYDESLTDHERWLVATGRMTLPKRQLDVDELWNMPEARVKGNAGTQAILDERSEGR